MNCYSNIVLVFLLSVLSFTQALPVDRADMVLVDDMLFTREHLEYLRGNVVSRNYVKKELKWPNSTLVYSFGQGLDADADASERLRIEEAMSGISNQTCLKFRKTTNSTEHQVVIKRIIAGCHCTMEFDSNEMEINLGPTCMIVGRIQHEFLHALGFQHMQSDRHRDDYVEIKLDNILEDRKDQFEKYELSDDFGFQYDYDSVMHYGAYNFAIDKSKPTIVTKQKGKRIGQRVGLSPIDAAKINYIYCPKHSST